MLKNYFIITIRNLISHKIFSLINILGLAVGITCTILIMLWVQDELSIDNYHVNGKRIAQVYLKGTKENNTNYQPEVSPAIKTIILNEYPGVINAVRMMFFGETVFKYNNKTIVEPLGAASDPSVFSIFSYPFIKGTQKTALSDPHSIVLTESLAEKYFGNENPIGKVVRLDNKYDFQVTGIVKDLPPNSFRKFDFLIPLNFMKEIGMDIEGTPFYPCNYLTYLLLKDNVNVNELSDKISKRISFKGQEISFEICLVSFRDAYLFETESKSKNTILILIALFILWIACINYINLSTARSLIRAREISIRKVTGATRYEIAKQFLSESIILTIIAAAAALGMAELSLPYFNKIAGKSLSIHLADPALLTGFIALIILTGLMAGIYPSMYLSRFNPVSIFRKNIGNKAGRSYRKILIVSQFVLSIFFIICTIVMSRQIHFIRNFNWGINKDNITYVRMEGDILKRYDALKHELLKNPNIRFVTTASNLPINISSGSYINWGKNDQIGRRICPINVSYDFLETFDIKMAEGRFYSREFQGDSSGSIIVNETAIKKIGLKNFVGNPFYYDGKYYNLIGVVKDYQHNSPLKTKTEPMVFRLKPGGNQFLFVKIDPSIKDVENITAAVNYIQKVCNTFSPEHPIDTRFLNEFSFENERKLETINQLILISTILMIFIACLGLYGLSSFINERRTKEIGVRKVLGASISNVVVMLSFEFCKWVLAANVIAWPLAYFVMQKVLQDYAFRVSIGIWVFIGAGFGALLIALFTVGWQAVRAANSNPVESLKYE